MAELRGDIGVGEGWWLVLTEPYSDLTDDGELVFANGDRLVLPRVIEIVDDASPERIRPAATAAGRLTPGRSRAVVELGPIAGEGWVGSLAREYLSPAGSDGEQQLVAAMGALDTFLLLTVRYPDASGEQAARELIRATYHEDDAA